jgi:hypothetical protein
VEDRRVVFLAIDWSAGEGLRPVTRHRGDLVQQVLAELPVDVYRVVTVVPQRVWRLGGGDRDAGAGWLAESVRCGLVVLADDVPGWRAGFAAADVVIGDHGPLTCPAAWWDVPILLCSRLPEQPAQGCALHLLGQGAAARLEWGLPVRRLIERALAGHVPGRYEPLAQVMAAPEAVDVRAARVLRAPANFGVPRQVVARHGAGALNVSAQLVADGHVALMRVPGEVGAVHPRGWLPPGVVPFPDPHLVVHAEYPNRNLLQLAPIIFRHHTELGATGAAAWIAETMHHYPILHLAAVLYDEGALAGTRAGRLLWVELDEHLAARVRDPLVAVSAVLGHDWNVRDAPERIQVSVGQAQGWCQITLRDEPVCGEGEWWPGDGNGLLVGAYHAAARGASPGWRIEGARAGAAGAPMPDVDPLPPNARTPIAWRVVQQATHASLLLTRYLSYLDGVGADAGTVPGYHLWGQQMPTESSRQHVQRLVGSLRLNEIHKMPDAGVFMVAGAETIKLQPWTAAGVIAHLLHHALAWCRATGTTLDTRALRTGARELVGVLCPAEVEDDAQRVLEHLVDDLTAGGWPLVDQQVTGSPFAAIHAAAALAAWTYGHHVTDRSALVDAIADRCAHYLPEYDL